MREGFNTRHLTWWLPPIIKTHVRTTRKLQAAPFIVLGNRHTHVSSFPFSPFLYPICFLFCRLPHGVSHLLEYPFSPIFPILFSSFNETNHSVYLKFRGRHSLSEVIDARWRWISLFVPFSISTSNSNSFFTSK